MLRFTVTSELGRKAFVLTIILFTAFSAHLVAKIPQQNSLLQRSDETGKKIPKPVKTEQYQLGNTKKVTSNRAYEEWTGTGPWGGIVRDICTAPDDDSIVLSACGFSMAGNGSVWRSEDGGNTWEDSGLSHKPFYALAASPSENGVFYAGGKYGFYKSTNYGEDWELHSYNSTFVLKIGVKLDDGNTILAGLASSAGVRRSTDGGENWETVGINSGFLKGISSTPANADKFVIAGSDFASSAMQSLDGGENWTPIGPDSGGDIAGYDVLISPTNEDQIILLHDDGIYGTADNGENWNLLKSGGGQGEFAVYDGNIYVGIWGQGVFVSGDNGMNWTHVPEAGIGNYWQTAASSAEGVMMGFWGGIKSYHDSREVWNFSDTGMSSPFTHALAYYADRNELWAGTEGGGVFRSLDHGETWERMINGLENLWIYDFAPLTHQDHSVDRMVIATASGLYISDDFGENWILKDMEGSTLTDVEIHWTDPDCYWEAEQMGTIKYTANNGLTWITATGLPFGLYPKLTIGVNENNVLRVFACFENGYGTSVYYSDDAGGNFTEGTGMTGISYHPMLSSCLTQGVTVYCATGQGIYKSIDHGESWQVIPGTSGLYWSVMGTLADDIFVGNDSGVSYSMDGGNNWNPINNGIANSTIWRIVYGEDENQLFVARRGEPVREYHFIIYPPTNLEITNGGFATWDPPSVTTGDTLNGYNIYLDGEMVAETITETEWQFENLTGGLTYTVGIAAVYEGAGESELVEATFIYLSSNEPEGQFVTLVGNFPNPFKNSTNIEFNLKNPSHVELSIYNLKGQLIKSLLNEDLAGDQRFEVSWDGTTEGTEVGSGIYYYKLTADGKTYLNKMVLIR